MTPPAPSAASVDLGSQILILGQVSKPSSKRIENVSFATLSGDLKGGVQDPVVYEPFSSNGPRHGEAGFNLTVPARYPGLDEVATPARCDKDL